MSTTTERLERRLAAILAADVVGYSRLMAADEEGTLARLNAHRRELLEPKIAQHHGRIVKRMGDGILSEFGSAVDAARCAIETQQGMAKLNEGVPTEQRIQIRIGIHVGDIIIEEGDIFGDGVNIAARLEGIAEPGGITLSEDAWRQVQGKVTAKCIDSGEQRLKNIPQPVRVYRLEFAGERPAALGVTSVPEKPSIAVLAFTNMSGDPEQEYFSDGISEDIITDLSKFSNLDVIARNSSFTYKGKPVDVKQIGRELAVRYVLEGSVRRAGNRIRVTGQLIDSLSGTHIWADRFDRDLTDIFAVQDELTREIIGALRLKLTDSEKARVGSGGTQNVEAHDLFLKGRELLFANKRDRNTFEQCIECFRGALELDSNYAAAYAGLGMAHVHDFQNRWSESAETSLDKAESLVNESIAKDDNDPFAHYVASVVYTWKRDHEWAAREVDRALALNPNFALANNARAFVHIYAGEPLRALPLIEKAIRLDPAQQLYRHFLGTAYFVAGNYETAAAVFKDRIAVVPNTDLSRSFLASALGHLGQLDEARRIWDELKEINPRYSYQDHFGRLPFRNSADGEKFTEGLRKAGLVE
jgi:adenylate cyclase